MHVHVFVMSKRTRKLPPRYKDNAIPLHHGIEESSKLCTIMNSFWYNYDCHHAVHVVIMYIVYIAIDRSIDRIACVYVCTCI